MKTIQSVFHWKTSDGMLYESKDVAEREQSKINMVERFGVDNIHDSVRTINDRESLRIVLLFLKRVYGFKGLMVQFMDAKCPLELYIDWKNKKVEYKPV